MPTPFGEIDGTLTPRLKRPVELLNRAGLRAKVSTHIVDYLARMLPVWQRWRHWR